MKIKRMFVGGPHENHYVVELSDGSFAKFQNSPFRKIEEKDLEPLHTYTAKGNRAEEVPEDLLKCYGLEKEKETRTVNVHFRFKPSIKSAAEKAAEKRGVSLSRYVESLIEKDVKNSDYLAMLDESMAEAGAGGLVKKTISELESLIEEDPKGSGEE